MALIPGLRFRRTDRPAISKVMAFNPLNPRKKGGSERGSDPHRPNFRSKGRSNIRLALILMGVAFVFYFGIMVLQSP